MSIQFNPNTISVLLDWDGVLFSWNDQVLKHYNIEKTSEVRQILKRDWGIADLLREHHGIERSKLDADIDAAGMDFWLEAPELPWATKLYNLLAELSNGQISICTSPGAWPESIGPKVHRMHEVLGCEHLISCRKKEWVARSSSLLVDDATYQVKAFTNAGGMAYQWPNQYDIEDDPTLLEKSFAILTSKIKFMSHHYELMQQRKPQVEL